MRRLVFLMVLTAALTLSSVAMAGINPYYHGQMNGEAGGACTAGFRSYSVVGTTYGHSGFVTGNPASPITQTVNMTAMRGSVSTLGDHMTGYFTVGPAGGGDWLQVGLTIGVSPGSGWNSTGNQWFGTWHAYTEYYDSVAQNYYFGDYGPISGAQQFSLTQRTDGLFNASINGLVTYNGALVRPGAGRKTETALEDLTADGPNCDDGDFYVAPQTSPTNFTHLFTFAPDLDGCYGHGNASYYNDWELFNKRLGGYSHGPGFSEAWTCRF